MDVGWIHLAQDWNTKFHYPTKWNLGNLLVRWGTISLLMKDYLWDLVQGSLLWT